MRKQVAVTGAFDDLRSQHVRFLEEASKVGRVTVLLWSDDLTLRFSGKPPKFPQDERLYLLEAIRFVDRVLLVDECEGADVLGSSPGFRPDVWAIIETEQSIGKKKFCEWLQIDCHIVSVDQLSGFPISTSKQAVSSPDRKKVIVTGCYDWFHSGHIRFFEEVSAYGDLYVIIGNDANIQLLKGEGHPLIGEEERRYMVRSTRHVKEALISSGEGWLDAEPEIQKIRPDIYAVNHDGDKGGKREFCLRQGIEYLVLERTPAPGMPKRSSTNLRGF